jgi:hypothetical protein
MTKHDKQCLAIFVGMVLFLLVACAYAGDATLNWTAPTQNTDGSPLMDLDHYKIYYGTSTTSLTQLVDLITKSLLTYKVTNLAPGTWFFSMTAINTAGIESDKSNVVSKVILPTKPNSPTDLTVTTIALFRLVQNISPTGEGDLVMVLLGTVPAGTSCDVSQTITTHGVSYNKVPRNTVGIIYTDNNRPPTVWAICS